MKNRTTQDVAHRVAFVARPSPTPSQSSSARMTRCMIVVSVFLLMCLTANATEAIINTPPATCRDKGFSDSLLCSQCEKLLLHLNTRASTSSGQQLVQECRDCCVADAAKDGSHDKPVTFQHARLELCRFHLRNSDIRGFIEDDAIKYKNLKVVFIFDRTPTLILSGASDASVEGGAETEVDISKWSRDTIRIYLDKILAPPTTSSTS